MSIKLLLSLYIRDHLAYLRRLSCNESHPSVLISSVTLLLLGCKHRARDSWRDIESKSP